MSIPNALFFMCYILVESLFKPKYISFYTQPNADYFVVVKKHNERISDGIGKWEKVCFRIKLQMSRLYLYYRSIKGEATSFP